MPHDPKYSRLYFPQTPSACYYRVCAQLLSCVTLCNPMNYSLPGSSVHGIFQARILEWVAISYSMLLSFTPPNQEIKISLMPSLNPWTWMDFSN